MSESIITTDILSNLFAVSNKISEIKALVEQVNPDEQQLRFRLYELNQSYQKLDLFGILSINPGKDYAQYCQDETWLNWYAELIIKQMNHFAFKKYPAFSKQAVFYMWRKGMTHNETIATMTSWDGH